MDHYSRYRAQTHSNHVFRCRKLSDTASEEHLVHVLITIFGLWPLTCLKPASEMSRFYHLFPFLFPLFEWCDNEGPKFWSVISPTPSAEQSKAKDHRSKLLSCWVCFGVFFVVETRLRKALMIPSSSHYLSPCWAVCWWRTQILIIQYTQRQNNLK